MLEKAGFTISIDADITLKEDDFKRDTFIGLIQDTYELIRYEEIIYIESFGHEIICHTPQKEYQIKEKLYEVESILHDSGFIRINKSQIISKAYIKEIKPTFNYRMILVLKNGEKVFVTRNYYQAFKKFIGL
jgi:two-component system response regulator LytT